jgi:hypothetical protein
LFYSRSVTVNYIKSPAPLALVFSYPPPGFALNIDLFDKMQLLPEKIFFRNGPFPSPTVEQAVNEHAAQQI